MKGWCGIAIVWVLVGWIARGAELEKDMTMNHLCVESTLAGSWYAADEAKLRAELERYLHDAPTPDVPAMAAIVPHAGYAFSGPCAAAGIRAVAENPALRRVLLLGFTHRVHLPGKMSVPGRETGYRSPLGVTPLDREALDGLLSHPLVKDVPATRQGENSVELLVPILQAALHHREWQLIPITLGQMEEADLEEAARLLKPLLDEGTAVVASSDFTHYGADFGFVPFRTNIAEKLSTLDHGAISRILSGSAEAFADYCQQTGITICGQDPIGLLLRLLPTNAVGRELAYDSSGARTGEYNHCVSYAAIGFFPNLSASVAPASPPPPSPSPMLSAEDQKVLLSLARTVIDEALRGDGATELEEQDWPITPAMKLHMGGFVTLTIDGELRGCIGEIMPRRPLVDVVAERALSAAFEDPRFPPLTAAEWPHVRIEISALTPPKPVASWKDIVIGKHGMTLALNGRSAVFLPQVAPEQGWDLETTLTHLSLKAGLPPQAWRDSQTRFTVFEAVVFHE